MTHYGNITTYDTGNGTGTIKPETGGEPLPFGKDDLKPNAPQPEQGQRFSYETKQAAGTYSATRLRQQEQDEGRKGNGSIKGGRKDEQRRQAESQQG